MTESISVHQHFADSAQLLNECADLLAEPIAEVAQGILMALMSDGKLLIAGNGAYASLANTLAAYMVTRLQQERMALAALSLCNNPSVLSALTNSEPNNLFAKQIHALGKQHDMLCVLSADGQSINLVNAIKTAHERDMRVLAITGGSGGEVASLLRDDDLWLNVPGDHPLRVLEAHQVTIHALCAQIDHLLLGGL
ncbi:D-sedoheptulose-7-phosphate isomerase [Snodgrassella gandavensis]|uniref:D-sedoheptulose-7-phosphate isomerase n=1 Tax=Snodgrassella gandavensis TaxID=2946698 RepID=UPI001EF6EBA4|nr:SIS domain-containing protein [Snodgrassella gandavensis]